MDSSNGFAHQQNPGTMGYPWGCFWMVQLSHGWSCDNSWAIFGVHGRVDVGFMSSEFFQRLAGLDAMCTSCEVKRAWYKAQSGEPNRTRFAPYLSPIQVESPGIWKHLWHNMAQQSNWMLLILCKLLCDFCHCPVAQPVSSWVESFDHVMQVTPSLWAFSYRRTHWPVATRQTLICPSWEPLASSSESLLKATAMTAFSCIIKLPAAHPGTSTSNESTNQA